MKKRRALSVALPVFMAFAISASPLSAAETYSDMPEGSSQTALLNAVRNGLLMGWDGKIMPNDPLPRAQMAAIMNRAFGAYVEADISSFTDVPQSAWYYADMKKGVQMQTFFGDGSNSLLPDMLITKEQAYAVIARAFKVDALPNTSNLDRFNDARKIYSGFKGQVAAMVEAGYVVNESKFLNPTDYITREEFAQVMYNIVQQYIRSSGTYRSVVKGNIMVTAPDVTLKGVTITGDLIIGEGVGDGDLYLDDVIVEGRIVARGGGEHSIHVQGKSIIKKIVLARLDGKIRLNTTGTARVESVQVTEGRSGVLIEGNVGSLTISNKVPVTVSKGKIDTVNITAEDAVLALEEGAKVDKVVLEENAKNVSLEVTETAHIVEMEVKALGATVTGEGTVEKVTVKADNVAVETTGTTVVVDKGIEGTVVGGDEVAAGSTVNPVEEQPTTPTAPTTPTTPTTPTDPTPTNPTPTNPTPTNPTPTTPNPTVSSTTDFASFGKAVVYIQIPGVENEEQAKQYSVQYNGQNLTYNPTINGYMLETDKKANDSSGINASPDHKNSVQVSQSGGSN